MGAGIKVISKVQVSRYSYNVAFLKKYGDKYKVQVLKCVRNKGIQNEFYVEKGSVNDIKLDCNIRRSKNAIKELVLCNDWDYFITFTLDKRKYNRHDLQKFIKDLSQYIRDVRKKFNVDIKYILIPEQHKDGAWHMHGFVSGLPVSQVKLFTLKEKLPKYIREKLENGQEVFHWLGYEEKFGFCDLEPIRDKERASSYVTKYITKGLQDSIKEVNAKMYYCSRGLKRCEEIKRGCTTALYNPTFEKKDDNDEFLYSEQWLGDSVSDQQARAYVLDKNNVDCLFTSILDEDIPFE